MMITCSSSSNWRASCKKGIYWILADFHFLQDWANFWRLICASFSRNNICKKTQLSSGDLLFNEKQKKPFVLLSFISHIITLISYCCFVKNKIHLITLYYSNKLTTQQGNLQKPVNRNILIGSFLVRILPYRPLLWKPS